MSWRVVDSGLSMMIRGMIERKPRVTVKKAAKLAHQEAKQAAREVKRAAKQK